ncbi:MAG: Hpt domain-containing protein [Lachnospiraceae bacterium]
MSLKECYDALGGDYESVKERITNDAIIEKFLIKFISEPSYQNLSGALDKKDYVEAFRAAHSLKGVCANLGFKKLEMTSSIITEYLRDKDENQIDLVTCNELFDNVTANYDLVVNSLKQFLEI